METNLAREEMLDNVVIRGHFSACLSACPPDTEAHFLYAARQLNGREKSETTKRPVRGAVRREVGRTGTEMYQQTNSEAVRQATR